MHHYKILTLLFFCLLFPVFPVVASPEAEKAADAAIVVEAGGVQAMGQALYSTHCAGCHRPLAKTTKAQRSASRLRSSIHQFPAMAGLDALSDEQLAAIAAALKTAPLASR